MARFLQHPVGYVYVDQVLNKKEVLQLKDHVMVPYSHDATLHLSFHHAYQQTLQAD